MKATDCFAEKRKVEIPTEKLLLQGWQDMLSAYRKYASQANDINNKIINREMKISNVELKRYTSSPMLYLVSIVIILSLLNNDNYYPTILCTLRMVFP